MSEPELTPRLEQVRALLQAIRGDDTTTLAAILAAIESDAALSTLRNSLLVQLIGATEVGPISDGLGGGPPVGAPFLKLLYSIINQTATEWFNRSASQLAADQAAVARLPRLTDIDIKFGNLGLFLGTALAVDNRSWPLGTTVGDIANAVENIAINMSNLAIELAGVNGRLDTTNERLYELLICNGCLPGSPDPVFPTAACNAFSLRWRFENRYNVLGTPGTGNPVEYRYGLDISEGANALIDVVTDPFFDFARWANVSATEVQACLAMAESARSLVGNWTLKKQIAPYNDPPEGIGGSASTVALTDLTGTGQQFLTHAAAGSAPENNAEWYCLVFTSPDGTVVPPVNPGVWLCWGGVG